MSLQMSIPCKPTDYLTYLRQDISDTADRDILTWFYKTSTVYRPETSDTQLNKVIKFLITYLIQCTHPKK